MQKQASSKPAQEFSKHLQPCEPPHIRDFSYADAVARGRTAEGYRFMLNEKDAFVLFFRIPALEIGGSRVESPKADLFYVNPDNSLRLAGFCDSELFFHHGKVEAQVFNTAPRMNWMRISEPHFRESEKLRANPKIYYAIWVHKDFSKGKGGNFSGVGELLASVQEYYAKSKGAESIAIQSVNELSTALWKKHCARLGIEFGSLQSAAKDTIMVPLAQVSEFPVPDVKRVKEGKV